MLYGHLHNTTPFLVCTNRLSSPLRSGKLFRSFGATRIIMICQALVLQDIEAMELEQKDSDPLMILHRNES